MKRTSRGFLLLIGLALNGGPTFATDHLDRRIGETILYERISPRPGKSFVIRVNTFLPSGPGPFPLVILNHGIDPDGSRDRVRFQVPAREFVQRGYAVMVPQRRSFGGSEGPRDWSDCQPGAYTREAQREIHATLRLALARDDIDTRRILLVGHSVGGLVGLKTAEQDLPGVVGVVNMAGGFRWENCDWQTPLLEEMRQAAASRIPSLWVYAENDRMFPPELARQLFASYRQAGGAGRLRVLAAHPGDGHLFFPERSGLQAWWPEVEGFMRAVGLPTRKVRHIAETRRPGESGFAAIGDVDSVPFVEHEREAGGKDYRTFLEAAGQRAFALSEDGDAWGWSVSANPLDEALEYCNTNSSTPCRAYALDQQVVW
ncbi:alpha/beta fold hydrolase [Pseudomonas aeruginosa]|uniref:dienelactone hydrolase family protein n=1 Tax=Pseudomonas paraeruginosa TaxID=2994495 RepID=UPI0018C54587|nr:alpha/beta fold hydrolase [Pseudomonas aeruginosa]MCR3764032.1 alpha/beta fold hydrolase [Pseudomonas aeruginosa]HBP5566225.1 alpha/beta fold hydrolase [Pseudomonas aeruginosa]HCF2412548.1 alpha/beta fold hydrolase [Pseudomonas aeruginosa]